MLAYERVTLTEDIWMTLRRVHADLKSRFIWTSDEDNFGEREHWDRPKRDHRGFLRGDCDDFMIECDHMLREEGLPADTMCFYRCHTETGGAHLVLGIHTDAGVFILDNREDAPVDAMELDDKGYHNWSRPQPGHPITDNWQTVDFGKGGA